MGLDPGQDHDSLSLKGEHMFTKQHMIAVARIVNESGARGAVRKKLIEDFGRMFDGDNPKFSWGRWREACEQGLIRARPNCTPRPL